MRLTKLYSALEKIYPVIFFLLFAALLIFSNNFDWDFFFSTLEIDLRSWFVDGKLPLWSYQMCAGVTRWGDPQSFGLSPLFVIPMIFGSFWGAKALWLVSACVGFIYLRKLLVFVIAKDDSHVLATAVSLTFIFGNHFLWHAQVGHLTFAMHYWALIPAFYSVKGLWQRLSRTELALGALALWAIFSGGLYHTTVFFFLPFYTALGLTIVGFVTVRKWRPVNFSVRRSLPPILGFHLAGIALAFYKLYGVATYQQAMPRTVTGKGGPESISLLRTLIYQLLPTGTDLGYPAILGISTRGGVWEYSVFSAAPCLLIASFVYLRFNPRREPGENKPAGNEAALNLFLVAYFLVALSFSTGDSGWISLHEFVNRQLLQSSIRAVGRYQYGISLFIALAAAVSLGKVHAVSHSAARRLAIGAVALSLLNIATFIPRLETTILRNMLQYPRNPVGEMREVGVVSNRSLQTSYMYATVLRGQAVINCYMPLTRDIAIMSEQLNRVTDEYSRPFLEVPSGINAASCLGQSYFTQNDLFISRACPSGTCTNMNGMNIYKLSALKFDPRRHKFCLP